MTQLFLVQFTLSHRRYSPHSLPPYPRRPTNSKAADDAAARVVGASIGGILLGASLIGGAPAALVGGLVGLVIAAVRNSELDERKPYEEQKMRLVEASDADGARKKVEQAYNYSSPGSDSVYVIDVDVSEVLR